MRRRRGSGKAPTLFRLRFLQLVPCAFVAPPLHSRAGWPRHYYGAEATAAAAVPLQCGERALFLTYVNVGGGALARALCPIIRAYVMRTTAENMRKNFIFIIMSIYHDFFYLCSLHEHPHRHSL